MAEGLVFFFGAINIDYIIGFYVSKEFLAHIFVNNVFLLGKELLFFCGESFFFIFYCYE